MRRQRKLPPHYIFSCPRSKQCTEGRLLTSSARVTSRPPRPESLVVDFSVRRPYNLDMKINHLQPEGTMNSNKKVHEVSSTTSQFYASSSESIREEGRRFVREYQQGGRYQIAFRYWDSREVEVLPSEGERESNLRKMLNRYISRHGAVRRIEVQRNGINQPTFRRVTFESGAFVTFCLRADCRTWFRHDGGGRYGPRLGYTSL